MVVGRNGVAIASVQLDEQTSTFITMTVNAEIISLAEEVAVTFESQAAAGKEYNNQNQKSLPTSITWYRTGRVLYSCHIATNANSDDNRSDALIASFDKMMSNLPRNYIRTVLLHNLHLAYASLILSFATSSSTTCPAITAIGTIIGKSSHHTATSISWKDIVEGTESICGIYLSSVYACCCECSSSEEGGTTAELELVFVSLSWVYDYISNDISSEMDGEEDFMQKSILKTLSRILIHGLQVSSSEGKSEVDLDEQLSSIMTTIQNIQSSLGEYNCALGDMLDMNENEQFVTLIRSKFGSQEPPQLQYLLAMLRASPKSDSKKSSPSKTDTNATVSQIESNTKQETQQTMADIQIEHIKSVLPSLGEGYIEEALKCYNHDVERTLEALLEASEGNGNNNSNIHPRLLTIPTNLPRKMRDSVDKYSANVNLHRGATAKDDGKEHLQVQKSHIRHVEKQAEAEAFLIENVSRSLGGLRMSEEEGTDIDDLYRPTSGMRDEYNDDYDDQYDGIGDDGGVAGGIGGMDDGLYDVDIHNVHQQYGRGDAKNDQEMWRQYNSLIKDVDNESKFWEDNRNMNRAVGKNEQADVDGEGKKYRGPDKGRGGRLIGPDGKYLPIKRGGKKKGRGGGGVDAGTNNTSAGGNNNAGRGSCRGRGGATGNNTNAGGINNAGRGSGRGRGAAAGRGGGSGDNEMTKNQKRKKNDNKAKVGNHHRKDRATKKASGGMVM